MSLPGGALVSARLCRLPEQELHQPSKKCTNRAIGAFCFVGAVLALASGKAERRQLHPLGWQRVYGRNAIPS